MLTAIRWLGIKAKILGDWIYLVTFRKDLFSRKLIYAILTQYCCYFLNTFRY